MAILVLEPRGQGLVAESEASSNVRRCLSDTPPDPTIGRESDSLPQDAAIAIPWRLDLNLRGPEAQELHTLLLKLAGNGITQLILMRMRQTTL